MGLGFNKSEAHWSYSGFNRFRQRLAKEINVDLEKMQGFGGSIKWETVDDPIVPFLHHSDCEGNLTPAKMRTIGPRILELIKDWPDKEGEWPDYDKGQATLLANDMIELASKNQTLRFC